MEVKQFIMEEVEEGCEELHWVWCLVLFYGGSEFGGESYRRLRLKEDEMMMLRWRVSR